MLHFLDTSVLKCAYIRHKFHRRCRYIVSRLKGKVFVAEISVLEIVRALGAEYRARRISLHQYQAADLRFLRDIAEGFIEVRPLPTTEFLACRNLLWLVGIRRGRKLTSQDGIIAYSARQLAIEKQGRVKLLTSDRGLASVVRDVDVFSQLVEAEFLDPN